MSDRIWLGYFPGTSFNKVGLRTKFPGHPWEAPYPRHHVPLLPPDVRKVAKRYARGDYVPREELPEASTVYDAACFARQKAISRAQICYIVDEAVAGIMAQFDLGPGGLSPYPIYEADEKSPIAHKWFLLGRGAQKAAFLPEHSSSFSTILPPENGKPGLYSVTGNPKDDDFAFSPDVLGGADLWSDPGLSYDMLYSDTLGSALVDAGYGKAFGLMTARVLS